MITVSRHYLFELEGCSALRLNSPARLLQGLERLCAETPLHPVKRIRHEFSPHGLTAFMILKESHLALSTWPEYRYACLNILLCGASPKLERSVRRFAAGLRASRVRRRVWTCRTGTRPSQNK